MIKEPAIYTFHPRRTRNCVMIGVLNEGERFTRQLKRLTEFSCEADIIIADGGSTDGATGPESIAGQAQA